MKANAEIPPVVREKHSADWLPGALMELEQRLVARELDADAAMQCITAAIESTNDFDGAAVAITSDDGSLICVSAVGLGPAPGSVLNPRWGLYAECLSTGRMVRCQHTDPGAGFQAAIAMPLWTRGRVAGVLCACSARSEALGHSHIALLGTAAAIAGLLTTDITLHRKPPKSTVEPASVSVAPATADVPDSLDTRALLAGVLKPRAADKPKSWSNRVRALMCGLGLLVLSGVLFGSVRLFRSPVLANHKAAASSIEDALTVGAEIGHPVVADPEPGGRTRITAAGQMLQRVDPVYPADAMRDRIEGKVAARILVDERGIVQDVHIVNGHQVLVTAVGSALSHWRYSPFYSGSRAVPVQIPVCYTFRMTGQPRTEFSQR